MISIILPLCFTLSPMKIISLHSMCLWKAHRIRSALCSDKKEVYGFALLALTYSNEAGGIVVWLEEIYVKPEHRCKGITGEFFKFIEKEYADAARIRLETEPDNERAVRLYERNGFTKLGYSQMYKGN